MRYAGWFLRNDRWLFLSIFSAAALLLGLDIVDDLAHGSTLDHILVEIIIVLFMTIGAVIIVFRYHLSKRENIQIRKDLTALRNDLSLYKEKTQHLHEGLSQKIDEQLTIWKLSSAEKEIALLLLKGMSNKEISTIRGTSERTISQQASSIYEKSGLHSRSELSAYFLEDLLSPRS
jgi:DNA-binding CsgD family transcriptional regulator